MILTAISTLTSATAAIQATFNWTILVRYTDQSLCLFKVSFHPKQGSDFDPCRLLHTGNILKHDKMEQLLATFHEIAASSVAIERAKTDAVLKSILRGFVADTDAILQAMTTTTEQGEHNSLYEGIESWLRYVVDNFETDNLDSLSSVKKEFKIRDIGRFWISRLGGVTEFGAVGMQHQINLIKAMPEHRTNKNFFRKVSAADKAPNK